MELQFETVTWPVPAVWAVGLVVLLIGFFIGFLDSNLRTNKKIIAAEVKAEAKIREAENKMILAAHETGEQQNDDPGLLRLKKENAHYSLEMDGRVVGKPLSPDEKRRLIELITIFRPWLDGGQPSQPASQLAAPTQSQPMPVSVQSTAPRPMQPIMTVSAKAEADKAIRAMSIVNQIDTVLQARLVDTPLEKAGIRLQESPEGGVEVIVGLEKFATVDDVRDAAIKKEIRAAIAEWEEKYVPGAR